MAGIAPAVHMLSTHRSPALVPPLAGTSRPLPTLAKALPQGGQIPLYRGRGGGGASPVRQQLCAHMPRMPHSATMGHAVARHCRWNGAPCTTQIASGDPLPVPRPQHGSKGSSPFGGGRGSWP